MTDKITDAQIDAMSFAMNSMATVAEGTTYRNVPVPEMLRHAATMLAAGPDLLAELDNLKRQNAEIVNLLRRLQPCLVTSHGDNTEFTYCIPYTLNDDIREAIARATNQPETAS